MSSTVEFDQSAGNALERAYLTADVIEQRTRVLAALELQPGEHVLDVGPGPGLLLQEMADQVGSKGRAVGADLSKPMLDLSKRRCGDLSWVELVEADAAALGFEPESFDAIVSTQVYEYVADIPAAFAKLFEITRPGGRVAILDTDYDSLVVFTEDAERHQRILEAWDAHFVHRGLPRTLGPELRGAGFEVRSTIAIPIVNTGWNADEFSFHLTPMMASFAAGSGRASKEDADAWLAEFKQLGTEGRYFFSLNRYLVVADKPAGR
jgi:arsenite methyltransferase